MKKLVSLLTLLALLLSLAGCGDNGAKQPDEPKDPPAPSAAQPDDKEPAGEPAESFDTKYAWSLSTTYATGSPMVDGYFTFAELLSDYTDGAIDLQVFPDGTLYGETDAIMAVKGGELEFTGSGPIAITTHMEEYGFITAPFMITSWDQMEQLWSSDLIGKALDDMETSYNTKNVGGLSYRGFRNTSCSKPVTNVDDFQGVLLRMNTNAVMNAVFNGIGAVCVPISLNELYSSLQNGAVQASEGPWEQMVTYNLYEVQDYIMETRHLADSTCIWMDNALYDSLPAHYQAAVDRAAQEAAALIQENCTAQEADYLKTMQDKGCELVACDISGFIANAETAWNDLFASTWTVTTLDEVRSMAGIA